MSQQHPCCNGEREAARFKEIIIPLDLVPVRHNWVLAPIWGSPDKISLSPPPPNIFISLRENQL